ncbi:MAG: hypothetical protein QNJ37_14425 [Crocosphaera sp.]|nr:hypothetical protein [Crocosphaera sp.]
MKYLGGIAKNRKVTLEKEKITTPLPMDELAINIDEDKSQARELYAKLREGEYNPWLKALCNSDMFIACLSSVKEV